jgi:hypothetical protein
MQVIIAGVSVVAIGIVTLIRAKLCIWGDICISLNGSNSPIGIILITYGCIIILSVLKRKKEGEEGEH